MKTLKKLPILIMFCFTAFSLIAQTQNIVPQAGINGGPTNGDNGVVGNLEGVHSISPSGAMVYTLPIITPEGAGGLKPNLSIVYNSQAGNGLLGIGWNLVGLSSIQRVGRNLFSDGEIAQIEFSVDDRFVIDGQRLIAINGTYGANGTIYATETETYSKITSYGATTNGPEKFIVQTKDGLTIEYGNTSDSRIEAVTGSPNSIVTQWLINKISNKEGYCIDFIYDECMLTGEVRIFSINYSSHPTFQVQYSNQYSIIFGYQAARTDNSRKYLNGALFESNSLLTSISINYYEDIKYLYSFSYQSGSYGPEYSYLKEIKLSASEFKFNNSTGYYEAIKGVNGIIFQHFNPIEISWTDEGTCSFGTSICSSGDFCYSDGYTSGAARYIGDFNGDGKSDILGTIANGQQILLGYYSFWDFNINVSLSTGNGFGQSSKWSSYKEIYEYFEDMYLPYHIYMISPDLKVGDVNGDGLDDIVIFSYNQTIFLKSTGTGFIISDYFADFADHDCYLTASYDWLRYLSDINGDGRADIIGFGESGVNVKLSQGNTFGNTQTWTTAFSNSSGWNNNQYIRTIGDVNGDGMADLIGFGYQAVYTYLSNGINAFVSGFSVSGFTINPDGWSVEKHPRYIVDVNGDGNDDIVGFSEDNVLVSLSTGVSFLQPQVWSNYFGYNDGDGYNEYNAGNGNLSNDPADPPIAARMMADVNGDGMADIVAFAKDYVKVALSTGAYSAPGNGFGAKQYWHTGYCYNAIWDDFKKYPRMTGDFNGDGRSDIIGFGNTQFCVAYSNKEISKVSGVKNSYDVQQTFEYGLITENNCYTKGASSSYPILTLQKPLYVLHKHINPLDGYTTIYNYSRALVHLKGKGFLGFEKIETSLNTGGITHPRGTTEQALNTDFFVLYPNRVKTFNNKGLVSETQYSTIFEDLAPTNSSYIHYRIYNDKILTIENHYEISQSNGFKRSILNTYSYDSYGNILQSGEYISGVLKTLNDPINSFDYSTETSTSYITNLSSWLLGLPSQIIVTKKSPGNANDVQKTNYTYHSTSGYEHRLKTVTQTPNNNLSFVKSTNFEYDILGNVREQTISSNGLPDRVTEFVFDLNHPNMGRFLTKTIQDPNGLNFESNNTYEPVGGVILTSTDVNGLTTTFNYDNFYRLFQTDYPEGTSEMSVLRWVGYEEPPTNDEPEGSLFYTWSSSSGNAPEWEYYNQFQLPLRQVSYSFNGNKVFNDFTYHNNGRPRGVYDPYFKGGNPQNETYKTEVDYITTSQGNSINYLDFEYNGFQIQSKYYENYYNTTPYKTTSKTYNIVNQLVSAEDNGGTINYRYNSNGSLKSVEYNGNITQFNYDAAGNKISINDPNAGITSYAYNAYNEMVSMTDPRAFVTNYNYDQIGRLTEMIHIQANEVIQYQYDNATNSSGNLTTKGLMSNVVLTNSSTGWTHSRVFIYDAYNRVHRKIENYDGKSFDYGYWYNSDGKIESYEYPNGLHIGYQYNTLGYLNSIYEINQKTEFWRRINSNSYNQSTIFTIGGAIPVYYDYNSFGILNRISAGSDNNPIQDLEYSFNIEKSQLTNRVDHIYNMGETFQYDNLNRLVSYRITDDLLNPLSTPISLVYSQDGNINEKSDVGIYNYQTSRPNAVSSITNPVTIPSEQEQITTYNHFNKISYINHVYEEKELSFWYNMDNQRSKTEFVISGVINKTKYYQGDYEQEVMGQIVRHLNYIYSPDGLVAIVDQLGSNPREDYFVLKDHLNSIYALINKNGDYVSFNGLEQIYSFDPWGKRRDYKNWSQPVSTAEFLIDRGYTGHEMLDEFDLINMNGRLYDPVIARFFSPDPFVQAPDFSQNYNRYSYVINNPLVYTDPSGEFIGSIYTAIWDFGTTIFTKGGLEFWNWRSDYVQNAWRDFDPSGSWSKTNKAWRIDVGLLKTDPNRTVVGRGLQFASRFLWELPQTLLGNMVSHARNITGFVDNVSYYGGATLVNNDDPSDPGWLGFSLGSYINSKNMEADPYTNAGFRHEYGHTLQSMLVGPLYLTRVGIPSLIGSGLDDLGLNDHDREWYETQANRMSERYFRNHDPGALTALPWNDIRNPREYNPNWYWMFAHPNSPFMWWLFF